MQNHTLIRPVQTEKATNSEKSGIFSFVVHPSSTKHQIKKALEKKFSVVLGSIRIVNCRGKKTRVSGKGYSTQRSNFKKAYVKVISGTIETGK